MRLKVIGSGSAGNVYLLETAEGSLLLDLGLRWETILRNLPDGIRNVKACLVTHEHGDHAKAVPDALKRGMSVLMSHGTEMALQRDGKINVFTPTNKVRILREQDVTTIPPFTVMAIKAMHDAEESLAFLIRHDPTGETVLYATDTYMLPNRYPKVQHWLIECNYTEDKAAHLLAYPEKAGLYHRLMESHLSLERLLEALAENDLSNTKTIVLIHISNQRGDSDTMRQQVQDATGIHTVCAVNGLQIDLGECPF